MTDNSKLSLTNLEAKACEEIIYSIQNDSKVICLRGNSGSGKTRILNYISKEYDLNKTILRINADLLYQNRDYFALERALTRYVSKDSVNYLKDGLYKDIESKSLLVGRITRRILSKNIEHQDRCSNGLTEREKVIINGVRYAARDSSTLFIIDDLQFLDRKTIELMRDLITDSGDRYSFIMNSTIIIAGDYSEDNRKIIEMLTKDVDCKFVHLPSISSKEDLNDFINRIDESGKLNLYSNALIEITDGNMHTLRGLVMESNFLQYDGEILTTIEDLWPTIIKHLIDNFGDSGLLIKDAMCIASLFGMTFLEKELKYATGYTHSQMEFVLNQACTSHILCCGKNPQYSFLIDDLYRAFQLESEKNIEYYKKISNCFKILYPFEYFHRSDLENKHHAYELSKRMYIMGCLSSYRNGDMDIKKYHPTSDASMALFMANFKLIYNYIEKRKYEQALSILDCMNSSDIVIKAEIDLLKSSCLTKSIDADKRLKSLNLLTKYKDCIEIEDEVELWFRLMKSLSAAYVHNGMNEYAKETWILLYKKLSDDSNIADCHEKTGMICSICRASNMIYECLISKIYMETGISLQSDCFKESYPNQYYLSMVNYASILTECGLFKLADEKMIELMTFMDAHPDTIYYRVIVMLSNESIIGYLSGRYSLSQTIEKYELLLQSVNKETADYKFFMSNYAVLNYLNGNTNEARKILEELEYEIKESGVNEMVYHLHCGLNLYAINVIEGRETDDNLIEMIEKTDLKNGVYIKKKAELLKKLKGQKLGQDIDNAIFNIVPKYNDTPWNYYGKTFFYTMMCFWSDL